MTSIDIEIKNKYNMFIIICKGKKVEATCINWKIKK